MTHGAVVVLSAAASSGDPAKFGNAAGAAAGAMVLAITPAWVIEALALPA